jgi:hypothetical protein
VVPLARRQALGIAVMSYDGRLGFGLLGDYDAIPELEAIARDLRRAIASLAAAAGVQPARKPSATKKAAGVASARKTASANGSPTTSRRTQSKSTASKSARGKRAPGKAAAKPLG